MWGSSRLAEQPLHKAGDCAINSAVVRSTCEPLLHCTDAIGSGDVECTGAAGRVRSATCEDSEAKIRGPKRP